MKKLVPAAFALLAVAAVAVSCKKREETPGEKLDRALDAAKDKTNEALDKAKDALNK